MLGVLYVPPKKPYSGKRRAISTVERRCGGREFVRVRDLSVDFATTRDTRRDFRGGGAELARARGCENSRLDVW
jgi:hypothetical protein